MFISKKIISNAHNMMFEIGERNTKFLIQLNDCIGRLSYILEENSISRENSKKKDFEVIDEMRSAINQLWIYQNKFQYVIGLINSTLF